MHAVVVSSLISDFENARKSLHEQVMPRVKQTLGFVSGCWLAPEDGKGMSIIIFENEDAAKAMASQMQPGAKLNEFVTIESVNVREVAGHA